MGSKGYLEFIDKYEEEMDEYAITESEEQEEIRDKPVIPEKKVIQKIVPKKTIKESSNPFSFCTSCGQKIPSNINGKFCPFCGKQTLMNTAKSNTIIKSKSISEDVDHANSILDDVPMENSRLLEYLSSQKSKSPLMNGAISETISHCITDKNISESTSHACDLLDDLPETGGVKLLEMPDFSRFVPQKQHEPNMQVVPEIPMAHSDLEIKDDEVEKQMRTLGLI